MRHRCGNMKWQPTKAQHNGHNVQEPLQQQQQ